MIKPTITASLRSGRASKLTPPVTKRGSACGEGHVVDFRRYPQTTVLGALVEMPTTQTSGAAQFQ
eukprot:12570312-Alexandrium_andersonii.AAC.1